MRKDLFTELGDLTYPDLVAVRTRVNFLLMTTTKEEAGIVESSYSAIEKHIEVQCRKYVEIPKSASFTKTTKDNLYKVSQVIYSLAVDLQLPAAGLVKLCSVLVSCAVMKLHERTEVLISFNTILFQLHYAADLLDWQFPGYVRTEFFRNLIIPHQTNGHISMKDERDA